MIEHQNEAARRLENQRRVYGPSYRPGRQRFLQDSLERDIRRIREALMAMDREDGVAYRIANPEGSRQEIAERLVQARRNALIHRNDEGVDAGDSRAAATELRAAKQAAAELGLSQAEEQRAKDRLEDRRLRLRAGARRHDPTTICPHCRNAILTESRHCGHCGRQVGTSPGKTVFLSHAWEDKAWVRKLRKHLANNGIEAWVDESGMTAGSVLWDALHRQIIAADAFVFIASGASVGKEWPLRELAAALEHTAQPGTALLVVPLLLEPDLPDLHPALAERLGVRAHTEAGTVTFGTGAANRMLDDLIRAINGQPSAP